MAMQNRQSVIHRLHQMCILFPDNMAILEGISDKISLLLKITEFQDTVVHDTFVYI